MKGAFLFYKTFPNILKSSVSCMIISSYFLFNYSNLTSLFLLNRFIVTPPFTAKTPTSPFSNSGCGWYSITSPVEYFGSILSPLKVILLFLYQPSEQVAVAIGFNNLIVTNVEGTLFISVPFCLF